MKKYLDLFKQAFKEFGDDKAARLGASLAYYTVFSIAPLLLISIAIAGMVFGREAAQGQIFAQLRGVMGASTAEAVQTMIKGAAKPKAGAIATIAGVITLLFGAAGVFTQLKDAMNTIWNVEPKKTSGIMAMIREKFLSMSMVFGVGFLLLVSLVVDAVIASFGKFASSHLPGGEAVWQLLQLGVSFGVVTVLFAMIFRFLPDLRVEWHDVWLGGAITSFLFVLGKFALGIYLGKAAVGSSFGAAGSLIVILVWVYWSAQVLFFGAELTQVYARNHGSMKAQPVPHKDVPPERRDTTAPVQSNVKRTPSTGTRAIPLLAGGLLGIILGGIITVVTTFVVGIKSVKKLLT